jgi:type VI secretion system protein ImpE
LYYTAWEKLSQKEIEEAQALFDQVDAQRPTVSGTVNGNRFASFKDTDTFLSLFLEAMVYERYVWIPFESIRELSITPPSTLFDLLWTTARITTWEGLTTNCYLPVLYPDSFLHEDDRVKLGRMTDWAPLGGSFSKGMGQHVFETGDEEVAMLEIREALFTAPDVLETDKKSD